MALTFASMPEQGGARAFLQRFSRRRDLAGLGPVLARAGALEARLAATGKEVRRAQRLRYRVFFEEGGGIPDPASRLTRRDLCRFDAVSDHILVVDRIAPTRDGSPGVVGAYRLLRQDVAERNFGFYSSREFELEQLIAPRRGTRLLEVGRACVAESHRGGRTLELLWRGLWAYARHHAMDAMIGCASLPGVDPAAHKAAIRWLAAGGDPSWRVEPRADRKAALEDDGPPTALDPRAIVRGLPPLVKGYWRLGATFSPIPALDPAFGATDLFVAMPLRDVEARYLRHFGVEPILPPVAA
ncbi:MAG: GNAT family N-acetyltransferase [Hyphomicrobiales bacterium]|nr:GNAT family N-acetyltransferase [Hyphomicrobiales bacterium]